MDGFKAMKGDYFNEHFMTKSSCVTSFYCGILVYVTQRSIFLVFDIP